jgi:hypothetical protein
MKLKRIDTLLNEETGEIFNIDDVIKIKTFNREYIGRIHWIETSKLTLDKSEQYKNNMIELRYEDILSVEKRSSKREFGIKNGCDLKIIDKDTNKTVLEFNYGKIGVEQNNNYKLFKI